jgi:phage tail protein X
MDVMAQQGETLDALCWRVMKRTAGLVEAVLEANPGLAEEGPILTLGRTVQLPDRLAPPQRALLQLWD